MCIAVAVATPRCWGPAGASRGRGGRGPPRFQDPQDIQFIKALKGHEKQVTALLIDEANNQVGPDTHPLTAHRAALVRQDMLLSTHKIL